MLVYVCCSLGPNLCPSKTCSFFHCLEESRNAKDIAMVQAKGKTTPVDEMPALKVANVSPRSVVSNVPSPTGTITPSPTPQTTTKATKVTKVTAPPPPPATIQQPAKAAESNIPVDLLCSLSKKLMEDPVLATDGMTYERAVIERYIEQETASKRPLISPVTGQSIMHPDQVPLSSNFSIKKEIDAWKNTHKVAGQK